MSSALPDSLRRILAKQKPKPATPLPESLRRVLGRAPPAKAGTISTLIWNDGEVWRETAPGRWTYLRNLSA